MANELKPTLTLTGTEAHLGSTLSLSVSDVLSVTVPMVGISKETITTADNQELIDDGDAVDKYVYVMNPADTNYGQLQLTAGTIFGRLYPGEFAFFPLKASLGLEVRANNANCIVEFGYWSRA